MKEYKVMPEYIDRWAGENVDELIVDSAAINRLADGWGVPVRELMEQVEATPYERLREAALADAAEQEDINALGKWFEDYGNDSWNGEYFDADDGVRVFHVYGEPDEYGDCQLKGYEIR